MPDQRDALGLELRQIIQADRMAADIIQNANYMRRSIEAKTEQEKARIIDESKQKNKGLSEKLTAELLAAHKVRREAALAEYQTKKQELEKTMQQNQEQWSREITQRITGT